jgi:hypothetical protein
MATSGLGRQLGAAVLSPVEELAAYLALITRANPRGSADALLARPDVAAMLHEALSEGHEAAMTYIEQGWLVSGADPADPVYARLQADADRIFGAPGRLRDLIARAHASVPRREFEPGRDEPGTNPGQDAAERRSAAVAAALTGWGRQAAQRARMALGAAEGMGRTAAAIESALLYPEGLRKRWDRSSGSDSCIWCRRLDGVTIGLRESFAPYLGGPAVMPTAGARRVATEAGAAKYNLPVGAAIIYTHPPRLYHGDLQGPLLHPSCECRLRIVRSPGAAAVPSGSGQDGQVMTGDRTSAPPAAGGFLAASDVRAMPEDQYRAGLALLRAAVRGMDTAMRGLAEGR